jgi:HSP20 family protein
MRVANLIRRHGGTEPEAVRRWDPFRIMAEMFGGDVGGGWMRPSYEAMFTPAFEVTERKDAYVFKADLPGFKEADLDIQLTGNRLTLTGKREAEEGEEGDRYYVYERSYGSFTRTFTLPEGVDAENVRAELKDGVLTLWLSKKPEVQPKRIALKGVTAKGKA